jgi:2-amino-4-hydroxy-6-hydroxymethyldihydropteridine diphosphokinase
MVTSRGGVFVGLGSNLGDRVRHIREALDELEAHGDITVIACSTLHETAPVGGPPGQGMFLNAVAELATGTPPHVLLARMQAIESRHGRERGVRNGPRTLDLDLLLYRLEVIATPELVVPHPRMWQRAFVMEPLAEICELDRLIAFWRLRGCARPERAADICAAAV